MSIRQFELNIENLGNIQKATIQIKPLTIIAGENSTGKTFITKSLYTVLDSVYKNHFINELFYSFFTLESYINEFYDDISPTREDKEFYKRFIEISNIIDTKVLSELTRSKFNEQEDVINKYHSLFIELDEIIHEYVKKRGEIKKFQKYKDKLLQLQKSSSSILNVINHRKNIIIDNISKSLEEGFKKNFQITNLNNLINQSETKKLKIQLDNLGSIEIEPDQSIHFSLKPDGIEEIQNVENIVFFDSPVYLKIRKALQNCRQNRLHIFSADDDKYLKGYPKYLDRLYEFIDREYIDTSDFNLISQEIQATIGGAFSVSKSGDIQYKDTNDNIMPLSLTAMGISNIGLIDLLLRNNVINKGSFLIMDEPEAHLHPEWQVKLVQILYKIAKQGANVIIATHSLDFLKAIQSVLKTEKDAEDIISINKMPFEKKFSELPELGKVNYVLNNLSNPFYKLHMDM